MLRNPLYVYGDENSLQLPADINYGRHMLHRFSSYGDNVAIIDAFSGASLTYTELAQMTVDIALSLERLGVRKGHVIAICSDQLLEYLPTVLGIICAGATFTPINSNTSVIALLHKTRLVKPKVVFCSPQAYDAHRDTLSSVGTVDTFVVYGLEERAGAVLFRHFLAASAPVQHFVAAPVQGWDDLAMILYSSGTTGMPKAVPVTHYSNLMRIFIFDNDSYYTGKTVISNIGFINFALQCLHAGAVCISVPRFEPKITLECIQRYKVKIVQQFPSYTFKQLDDKMLDEFDLSSVEHILSAGVPLRINLIEHVKKRFPHWQVYQMYGATETGMICTDQIVPVKTGSVGVVVPNTIIKVVDLETKEALGPNKQGEICVKCTRTFEGYIGDSSLSHLDEEGFYKTGDVGYYDEDRYFYIVDRVKDMIKHRGHTISPSVLEDVLLTHPAVLEAVVVGASDEGCDQLPTAFVVLRPGAEVTEKQLTAYVNDEVADCMQLAGGTKFIAAMPRAVGGKLDRKALRLMLEEAQ